MVQKSYGNTGKYLNKEYHETRWEAETETFSIDEWGPIDIERYDLDTVDFSKKYKRSTYKSKVRIDAEGAAKSGKRLKRSDIRD